MGVGRDGEKEDRGGDMGGTYNHLASPPRDHLSLCG